MKTLRILNVRSRIRILHRNGGIWRRLASTKSLLKEPNAKFLTHKMILSRSLASRALTLRQAKLRSSTTKMRTMTANFLIHLIVPIHRILPRTVSASEQHHRAIRDSTFLQPLAGLKPLTILQKSTIILKLLAAGMPTIKQRRPCKILSQALPAA